MLRCEMLRDPELYLESSKISRCWRCFVLAMGTMGSSGAATLVCCSHIPWQGLAFTSEPSRDAVPLGLDETSLIFLSGGWLWEGSLPYRGAPLCHLPKGKRTHPGLFTAQITVSDLSLASPEMYQREFWPGTA